MSECHSMCWPEAYAGLVSDNYLYCHSIEERRVARWRERLAGTRTVCLAEAVGAVVGVASAGLSQDGPPPEAVELKSLYVRASHYGTGLADRLLHEAIRIVRRQIEPRGTTHSRG